MKILVAVLIAALLCGCKDKERAEIKAFASRDSAEMARSRALEDTIRFYETKNGWTDRVRPRFTSITTYRDTLWASNGDAVWWGLPTANPRPGYFGKNTRVIMWHRCASLVAVEQ